MSKGSFDNRSDTTDSTDQTTNRGTRLRPSGGYRDLRSFQVTTIVYDGTVQFCERFVYKYSRMVDQMVQAARSGRQNIAEGSRAAATSSQTELRLVNVARASLEELLLDYEDFLRQRQLRQWSKDDVMAKQVRELGRVSNQADRTDRVNQTDLADGFGVYAPWLTHEKPEIVANTIICLIHQANYLLDQQISGLERQFITDGGYSEILATARIVERGKNNRPDPTDTTDKISPACTACGKAMFLRTARNGKNAGSQFWGCSGYPECKSTRQM
ncbi:MAG: four helix bundle suffix domain-containing protein [bacterium]